MLMPSHINMLIPLGADIRSIWLARATQPAATRYVKSSSPHRSHGVPRSIGTHAGFRHVAGGYGQGRVCVACARANTYQRLHYGCEDSREPETQSSFGSLFTGSLALRSEGAALRVLAYDAMELRYALLATVLLNSPELS